MSSDPVSLSRVTFGGDQLDLKGGRGREELTQFFATIPLSTLYNIIIMVYKSMKFLQI